MKKEKSKKEIKEDDSSKVSPAYQALIKSAEKHLPTFDKELAQFTACSALSLNSERFYNNFSMCLLLQNTIENKRNGKTVSEAELSSEDYLYVGIVTALLGNKVIDN